MLSYWRDLVTSDRIYALSTSGFSVRSVSKVATLQGTVMATGLAPTFMLGRVIRSSDRDLRMITGICYTNENGDIQIGELFSTELIDEAVNFVRSMDDRDRETFITPMGFYEIQAVFRL
jgi:hypothetical protein